MLLANTPPMNQVGSSMQRLFYGPRDGVSPLDCLDLSLWSGAHYRPLLPCSCELWDMRGTTEGRCYSCDLAEASHWSLSPRGNSQKVRFTAIMSSPVVGLTRVERCSFRWWCVFICSSRLLCPKSLLTDSLTLSHSSGSLESVPGWVSSLQTLPPVRCPCHPI